MKYVQLTLWDPEHEGPQSRKREWLATLRELRAAYGDDMDDEQYEEWA